MPMVITGGDAGSTDAARARLLEKIRAAPLSSVVELLSDADLEIILELLAGLERVDATLSAEILARRDVRFLVDKQVHADRVSRPGRRL